MPSRALRPSACCLQLLLTAGTLASAAALAGCSGGAHADAPKAKANEPQLLKAVVTTVTPMSWPAVVRTQGSLIADEVTVVGAKVAGRVNQINFDLGDQIKAIDVLATLDQEDFKLEMLLAEAQLFQSRAALGLEPDASLESLDPENSPPVREAKAVWDETRARAARVRQLLLNTRNTVTQEEYDQAVAAESAAEARHAAAINGVREKIAIINVRASELKVAQQRLIDTVIRAPFDGLVQERHVAHGSFLQLGDPICTLVSTSVLRFRGTMPERHAHRLALGQKVTLKIEGVPRPREVNVTRISPTVDEMSRSLVFEALIPNKNGELRTGLFAEAEVVVDPEAEVLVVPRSAILEFAGAEKVWKIVDGIATEKVVQTARHGEQLVEIAGGLSAGDTILVNAVQGRVARIQPIAAALDQSTAEQSVETAVSEELDGEGPAAPTASRGRGAEL